MTELSYVIVQTIAVYPNLSCLGIISVVIFFLSPAVSSVGLAQ